MECKTCNEVKCGAMQCDAMQVQMVKDKLRDEERVLEVCRTKVLQRSLPMRVMDAEFQYDRHKLTFFFEAEG